MTEQTTVDNIDYLNRDPNNLNDHIKVTFADIIGEPEGAFSLDFCWKCTNMCYNCSFKCCYLLLTTLNAPCIALYWGWQFAQLAFYHIYQITPCIKYLEINCGMLKKILSICLNCCVVPVCESCGAFFSQIRVQNS